MKDVFGREWEMVTLKDKKKKMKKKKKKISIAIKKSKLFVNNILFPNRIDTEKTIEEEAEFTENIINPKGVFRTTVDPRLNETKKFIYLHFLCD